MEPVGLKEAVEALRKELSASIVAAANESLRFEVGQITMEFQIGVERTAEGSGGIKFWVVELGGKGVYKSTEVHKVTPTTTSILDTIVLARYAASTDAPYPQETANVTQLPDPRRTVFYPDL
jgi:hypothetical protein